MTSSLKILIPMAGFGSRLRPLTWSKPKPLLALAGATVLDHLLAMFKTVPERQNAEFVFILGSFGGDLIRNYMAAQYPDVKVHYVVQTEMRGQSDALWQAREFLNGPIMMCFSDTLLDADLDFQRPADLDGIAWVKPVPDPRRFGVAQTDAAGMITRLKEKPQEMNHNLALVGLYYFRQGEALLKAIETQFNRNMSLKNEFYLVDAISIMLENGCRMRTKQIDAWLDAGTFDAVLDTNRYLLDHGRDNAAAVLDINSAVIVPPVFIHPKAHIENSVIGPYVSIGAESVIRGSIIKDAVIGNAAHITDSQLESSQLGDRTTVTGQTGKIFIGDDAWLVK